MKQTLKLAVTLAAYAVAACLALAAVYSFTAPQIEQVKIEKTKRALQAVFPEADDFKEVLEGIPEQDGKIKFLNAYTALKNNEPIGFTLTVNGPTYAKATILIAYNLDNTIRKIQFLELTDTPSLGTKAAEEPFIGQFNGMSMDANFAVGADINAISGATITSKGVSAILKSGTAVAKSYIEKNIK